MPNPLLSEWTTEFEIPPFAEITDDHFEPALDAALIEARKNIATIAEDPATPDFANTVEALELAEQTLGRVLATFYNVAGADSTPKREELQRSFAPKLAAYSSEISMNAALFARLDTLYEQRGALDLNPEEQRVLMLTHRSFVRSGAKLQGPDRERLKEITSRLAVLGTRFGQNLLADEREWSLELSADQLDGLPEFLLAAASAAADEKGIEGHVITLSRSLIVPFLQFSTSRDLRRKAWAAWAARGANGGDRDNRAIAAETLSLRAEKANILGYKSFADFKLETEMAKRPEAVRDLLMKVWEPARKSAESDAHVLAAMMQDDGVDGPLEPWDWRYYSEKRRKAEHDLDEAELKPYFQLDRMIDAAFDCAGRLFGLSFRSIDAKLYHPDARAWEVMRDGQHLAVFVGDYFARGSKRSGAWCSAMRSQQKLAGDIRPIVVNVCNFAKPAKGKTALLSHDDARTLFHEFGHALHQMLSDVTYDSISGTSVARDFVELPSQLFEHWLDVPEILEKHALHSDTGKPMPKALAQRLKDAATYDQGFATVEYVASAMVDLEFHQGPAPSDPMERQTEILTGLNMPHAIGMRHATPQFAHVFSGDGYASAYYSYMWSEVMDADAFEAFTAAGSAFDRETAKKLELNILSRGGSVDAEELYVRFRGRLPGVQALLKGRGLDSAAT